MIRKSHCAPRKYNGLLALTGELQVGIRPPGVVFRPPINEGGPHQAICGTLRVRMCSSIPVARQNSKCHPKGTR